MKHYKSPNISIKVYNDVIVIYNKRSRRLITTFKVPDKYLPVSNFYLDKRKEELKELINYIQSTYDCTIKFTFDPNHQILPSIIYLFVDDEEIGKFIDTTQTDAKIQALNKYLEKRKQNENNTNNS
jgi:hypothetical protein